MPSEELSSRESTGAKGEPTYTTILFSKWAWICYAFVFPAITALATFALAIAERSGLLGPWPYKLFDSVLAFAILVSFFLYRIVELLPRRNDEQRESGADQDGQE